MEITELRDQIAKQTGIPAGLIEGTTPEEIINRSRDLLTIRKEAEAGRERSNSELFADWVDQRMGQPKQDAAESALQSLDQIVEAVGIAAGQYPSVRDAGDISDRLPPAGDAAHQFERWFWEHT